MKDIFQISRLSIDVLQNSDRSSTMHNAKTIYTYRDPKNRERLIAPVQVFERNASYKIFTLYVHMCICICSKELPCPPDNGYI